MSKVRSSMLLAIICVQIYGLNLGLTDATQKCFYMIDMLGAWNMELFFYMFKLIMAKHYPNSVKTREIYRYNRMNNCLIDVCNT